jgi:hypothetical protein
VVDVCDEGFDLGDRRRLPVETLERSRRYPERSFG